MIKCEKGEKQHKMCKEANADYCSDCPHGVKEKMADKKIYFRCPKCKKIIERSKDNPFIKWKFLHLFCESYCVKHREKVLMRRYFK